MASAVAMLLGGRLGTRKLASYEVWCQHLSSLLGTTRVSPVQKKISSLPILYGRDHAIFIPMEGILPWVPLYLHHVIEGFGKMKVSRSEFIP